jgi:hypothetical protein
VAEQQVRELRDREHVHEVEEQLDGLDAIPALGPRAQDPGAHAGHHAVIMTA